ncbi:hypothetical protein FEM48_Zijuj11G0093700 [Ziziphus jujuba var. spinosa]|uniref:Uncharacterized protein n=1 Tax=Ziziphus jujuba var. spinosa TaxID=714518 RepID=A0A978UI46_ZIZJJ|nr:hypothetical protein FEM48_Zijuj11G0093700 [Ziziphus jujuba var. spinosa]
MAVVVSINWQRGVVGVVAESQFRCRSQSQSQFQSQNPSFSNSNSLHFRPIQNLARRRSLVNGFHGSSEPDPKREQDEEVNNLGVKAALSVLKFYKREISPILPKSCRYVPSCSEYSMEAYKKYGFVKGSVLTAWRLCRCNPLGGSGFDPPRWFDEKSLPEDQ